MKKKIGYHFIEAGFQQPDYPTSRALIPKSTAVISKVNDQEALENLHFKVTTITNAK